MKIGYNPKTLEGESKDLLKMTKGQPRVFFGAIEKLAVENQSFRKVIYTTRYTQLVLMSLLPNETIDREVHNHNDQVFRFEEGSASVYVENPEETLHAESGDLIVIPAGTYHTIVAGPEGVKLYTLYSPANHPYDRVQDVKPEED